MYALSFHAEDIVFFPYQLISGPLVSGRTLLSLVLKLLHHS